MVSCVMFKGSPFLLPFSNALQKGGTRLLGSVDILPLDPFRRSRRIGTSWSRRICWVLSCYSIFFRHGLAPGDALGTEPTLQFFSACMSHSCRVGSCKCGTGILHDLK